MVKVALIASRTFEDSRVGNAAIGILCLFVLSLSGCGTTRQRAATEQLIASDAVDAAIAQIDFSPLTQQKVYFDSTYIRDFKGIGFVNSNYIISALRQQIIASGCLLQDKKEDADFVIEGRIGALGTDAHDVTYGIPQSKALTTLSAAIPGAPPIPTIPELSIAKKQDQQGAAKIAMFAYHRETRERVWQSGLSVAHSTAKDTWIMGAGPFQQGTIYNDRVHFAGSRIGGFFRKEKRHRDGAFASYQSSALFYDPRETLIAEEEENQTDNEPEILQVDGEKPVKKKQPPPPPKEKAKDKAKQKK